MGWQDRDYNRNTGNHSRGGARGPYSGYSTGGGFFGGGGGGGLAGGGGFSWSSMTGRLLIINIAVFFIGLILGPRENSPLYLWGAFSFDLAILHGHIWRVLTFQFLHADVGHIFFNMLALFIFGPIVERYLGSRRYLAFYLICGVGGALLYVLLFLAGILGVHAQTPMVGASAGIFGLLVGTAVIAPDARVMLLFPPIPMKMRTMALVFLGIAGFMILTGGPNAGGEAAHLGGAAAGYLLIRRANWLNFADGFKRNRAAGSAAPQRSAFLQRVADYKQQRRKHQDTAHEKEVDRILIKVKEQGLQSLTDAEKQTLQKETTRRNP